MIEKRFSLLPYYPFLISNLKIQNIKGEKKQRKERRMSSLREFSKRLQNIGTLRGFKHFSLKLHSSEELFITLKCPVDAHFVQRASKLRREVITTQKDLVPVAENSAAAIAQYPQNTFLLTCYEDTTQRPLVWSCAKLDPRNGTSIDPVRLVSTHEWKCGENTRPYDVISELVKHFSPEVQNALQIDFDELRPPALPQLDGFLMTGALMNMLWEVFGNVTSGDFFFRDLAGQIKADLNELASLHYSFSLMNY